jgi:hypothetical protein
VALIIVLSVVAALLAIAAYQLIIRKYYWGPAGPPKNDERGLKDQED